MKRTLVAASLLVVVLSACTTMRDPMATDTASGMARVAPPAAAQLVDANGAPIERVPFVSGVSSMTVEKLAAAQACRGGEGAARVTPAGPVEVYRLRCADGRTFMARCEMRQCRQM